MKKSSCCRLQFILSFRSHFIGQLLFIIVATFRSDHNTENNISYLLSTDFEFPRRRLTPFADRKLSESLIGKKKKQKTTLFHAYIVATVTHALLQVSDCYVTQRKSRVRRSYITNKEDETGPTVYNRFQRTLKYLTVYG